jgi:regulator of sirC expression with transglutaminase-like and TPR domain
MNFLFSQKFNFLVDAFHRLWFHKLSFFPVMVSLLLSFGAINSHAQNNDAYSKNNTLQVIDRLIASQDLDKGLLDIKLTIDKLIDDELDITATRSKIKAMVKDVESMISPEMTGWQKIDALRSYIYEPGEWNDHKPFSYDLDDPQGQSRESRLLHNYLRTRKGNCVSMPVLHAILGQELGLDVTISTAPLHVFVKYTDESGKTINIEATSGGYPAREEWYQKGLPMLPKAIENGMFMAKLTPKQTIAVLGQDVASHLLNTGDYENSILVSEKLIPLFPNYAPLYMTRGSGYYKLIERDFQEKYPDPNDIPKELQPKFKSFMQQNIISFQKADALGWADPDELLEKRKAE